MKRFADVLFLTVNTANNVNSLMNKGSARSHSVRSPLSTVNRRPVFVAFVHGLFTVKKGSVNAGTRMNKGCSRCSHCSRSKTTLPRNIPFFRGAPKTFASENSKTDAASSRADVEKNSKGYSKSTTSWMAR
jgi:hypothetical protein